ncbi:hypothetical protein QC763_406430 [Podospora pseudopauciseta]|uniref:Tr-type G domain-containing protein n=2 Tax=Podospora TaxID=5144 RepID=A0ABR0HDN4_9PEZI|nr:hypothetical protein QC763_406430 [Podospora pseudopauciseta]KAK4677317.1 hypothetical protein QC764_406430 [Podospora pseudoanserina]
MSRHRAIRNLDYEEVLDEYEVDLQEEEENRLLMEQGVVDVRSALDTEASKVTKEQIEEALWHYYFDVDKSVTYLTNKFINRPAPKAPKPATQKPTATISCEFEDSSDWAENNRHGLGGRCSPQTGSRQDDVGFWVSGSCPSYPLPQASLPALFHDMPWGNIPKDRESVLIPPVVPRSRCGLLGGTGAAPKMTKLQALAAARKKKAQEKSSEQEVEQTRAQMTGLSVSSSSTEKENMPLSGAFSKRLKTSSSTAQGRVPIIPTEPRSESEQQSANPITREPEAVGEPAQAPPVKKAQPSAFAQTLFSSHTPAITIRQDVVTLGLAPSVLEAFSKPSPDDIVLAAQAKAGKKPPAGQSKKSKSSNTDSLSSSVSELKIDDTPLPKSRNINVLSEFEKSTKKKSASFVVVGHVDAGKSTMMGRLLLDLGVVDQRTVEKLRKEAHTIGKSSFALAWVLDQGSEERTRGVTIDIATNRFETETTAFTILDAPGHRDFIPNMIAGASQADFAVLVIDASTGAFESGLKGQTKEHSLLLRSMGVARIIVAVNKLDMVNWSQERFDEIKNQVSGFLSATGFQKMNIAFVPVSGLHGDNMVKKSENPAVGWYTGPTLIEELERSEPSARATKKPLRVNISEVFRTQQSQATVSGRVDAGSLQMGDAVLVQPATEKAFIKSILVDEAPADWAVAGQSVVLHLSHIDPMHVKSGDIICDPNKPIPKDKTFTLKALAFDFLMPMQVDVHRGRLHSAGKIIAMPALLDKTTGGVKKKNPRLVKPGEVARVRVELDDQVPLEAGQRVVLRSGGETIAAGLLE